MNVNWDGLWYKIFGMTQWHGIAMGFWVGMVVVAIVVVLMNVVEWNFKKFDPEEHAKKEKEQLLHEHEMQKRHEELKKQREEMFK